MGMRDFRRTQVFPGFSDMAKRAFTYCLKMSYGFGQRRKAPTWSRLIRSIKTHAAIRTTSENAIIAPGLFRIAHFLLASHQTEHDFFCHGDVFRTLEDRPTALRRPQAAIGFTYSRYAVKKSFFSLA
jgi:hypothetical protein